ncbi:phosphotransferase [Nocardia alni]|uniref:phosphotransferase n=1 Tax=Nocardia alni TaxID=2815723 RepID=UPI001C23496A|nr:phosphotransferase [Nocardia alni]
MRNTQDCKYSHGTCRQTCCGKTVFRKIYADPERAAAAAAHYRWISALGAVQVPALLAATESELTFEDLGSHHPGPDDLVTIASAMGDLHAAAWDRHLYRARLDRPFRCGELTISDFISPRRNLLARFPAAATSGPVAFYKDCNIRNFMTDSGLAVIDFDDLTLAPFGYDLGKLIVSSAMTHGRPDPVVVSDVLDAYNDRLPAGATCSVQRLRLYTYIHHELTSRYLHQHGYRYLWPDVSPWPAFTYTK